MIFVTVGAQMPFDRMVQAVDEWAGRNNKTDIFAQIGHTAYRPRYIQWVNFLDPPEFRKYFQSAGVIVAHAGMGSIITALELGKPILVMPRRGDLAETRNDHQVATARQFRNLGYVAVALDETEMLEKLDQLDQLACGPRIGTQASPELLAALRQFISQEDQEPVHSSLLMPFMRKIWRKTSMLHFNRT
jgi:UDP-N-acetylglucosamine transferase subunit ALG13